MQVAIHSRTRVCTTYKLVITCLRRGGGRIIKAGGREAYNLVCPARRTPVLSVRVHQRGRWCARNSGYSFCVRDFLPGDYHGLDWGSLLLCSILYSTHCSLPTHLLLPPTPTYWSTHEVGLLMLSHSRYYKCRLTWVKLKHSRRSVQ